MCRLIVKYLSYHQELLPTAANKTSSSFDTVAKVGGGWGGTDAEAATDDATG